MSAPAQQGTTSQGLTAKSAMPPATPARTLPTIALPASLASSSRVSPASLPAQWGPMPTRPLGPASSAP